MIDPLSYVFGLIIGIVVGIIIGEAYSELKESN